jgi:hypothetical protein
VTRGVGEIWILVGLSIAQLGVWWMACPSQQGGDRLRDIERGEETETERKRRRDRWSETDGQAKRGRSSERQSERQRL